MKPNEAPGKIYMTPSFGEPDNVLLASFSKSHLNFHRDIEYIRKDAFVEKAVDYIANNMQCNGYTLQTKVKFIRDFKKYMEK